MAFGFGQYPAKSGQRVREGLRARLAAVPLTTKSVGSCSARCWTGPTSSSASRPNRKATGSPPPAIRHPAHLQSYSPNGSQVRQALRTGPLTFIHREVAVLDSTELPPNPSERIRENYEYFREQVASANPDDIYRGLDRLIVVDVTLDHSTDDPQLIFESLNSTGIDLSQSDLIRNYVLMRLPSACGTFVGAGSGLDTVAA